MQNARAVVASLHIYPIKSCLGIDLFEGRLGAKGLEANRLGDRQWVVSDANGVTLTQREYLMLALVAPRASSGGMVVSAPGMTDLPVAMDGERRGAGICVMIWQKRSLRLTRVTWPRAGSALPLAVPHASPDSTRTKSVPNTAAQSRR